MKKIQFKINKALRTHKVGDIITLDFDESVDRPLDCFWARRYKDAKIDNCIEKIVVHKPTKKVKANDNAD